MRSRQFHVQFFGDEAERGWIPATRMLLYKGEREFNKFANEMMLKDKKNRKWYEVAPRRRKAWEVAVSAAEAAFLLSREDRKLNYTFTYKLPKGKKNETTAADNKIETSGSIPPKKKAYKRRLTESSAGDGITPPRKRHQRDSLMANPSMTQFAVYCLKRKDSVKAEHPDFKDEDVENCLRERWGQMEEDERTKFIPMGPDMENLHKLMPFVGTQSKYIHSEALLI